MRSAFLCLCFLFFSLSVKAEKYYVFFTDKQGETLNPYAYFHPNTINRRIKNQIPLVQKSDLPVSQVYVNEVINAVDSYTLVSRWFNMVCVHAQNWQIAKIENWPFVAKVVLANTTKKLLEADNTAEPKSINTLLEFQTRRMQANAFWNKGFFGNEIIIAVLDAGFSGADKHNALAHLQLNAVYDFVGNDENPFHGSTHGTSVLSVIGGIKGDTCMGLATKAHFLLARTERHHREFAAEEEYWLAAAEWADKNGADIINTSLGYTLNRYFVEDMNGSSLVAKAANMAFSKGILVIASAGNEGEDNWKFIGTPADADSVIAVGGIDPYTDRKSSFSSFGPNAKGQIKPNVASLGTVFACTGSESFGEVDGTSFSSPLVAGFAACLMQAFPNKNHKEIFDLLQECGSLYPYYDYAHGYGIPQARLALYTKAKKAAFFTLTEIGSKQIVLIPADSLAKDTCNAADFIEKNYFVKVQTKSGKIVWYKNANAMLYNKDQWPTVINQSEIGSALKPNEVYEIYVHFEGFTQMIKIQWD